MKFKIGCVPFVNARPLIEGLAADPDVKLILAPPSQLPAMLDEGEIDVALVSSFEALRREDRVVVPGLSISSLGPAESVRLFSKVPFSQIRSVALDQSSLTSNQLLLAILRERYGVNPRADVRAPSLSEMLEEFDAGLLIGDLGMSTSGDGLYVMDLGDEWRDWQDLPFVWALWTGRRDLSPALADRLAEAHRAARANLEQVITEAHLESGWSLPTVDRYLRQTMNYELSEDHRRGLAAFRQLVMPNGPPIRYLTAEAAPVSP